MYQLQHGVLGPGLRIPLPTCVFRIFYVRLTRVVNVQVSRNSLGRFGARSNLLTFSFGIFGNKRAALIGGMLVIFCSASTQLMLMYFLSSYQIQECVTSSR